MSLGIETETVIEEVVLPVAYSNGGSAQIRRVIVADPLNRVMKRIMPDADHGGIAVDVDPTSIADVNN